MNINNILPNFKGLAEERPVQFLTEFEIRAVSLVGKNDTLLLQTVQQALSEGALIWFSQLQRSPDRAHNWKEFKTRFYERYRTPTKVEHLRTELRLLFQRYNESTLDYFERLKTLMVEIDPDCNDQWVKSKFIQKLRPDIRTRFDDDINLSIREVVRKAQAIETSIERQKIDEKLRIAASQENNNSTNFITNNISFDPVIRQRSLPVPTNTTSSIQPNIYYHNNDQNPFNNNQTVDITNNCLPINETGCLPNAANNSNCFIPPNNGRNMISYDNQNNYKNNNNNNNNYNDNNAYRYNSKSNNHYYNKNDSNANYIDNSHMFYHDPHHSYNQNNSFKHKHSNTKSNKNSNHNAVSSCDPFMSYSSHSNHSQPSHSTMSTHVKSSKNNKISWWCPQCKRHGHSWERCSFNPESINYRPNVLLQNSSSTASYSSTPLISSATVYHDNSHKKN
ncbi:unnamed protein product [Rotaria socialis]|nr:unnamed protein product [Rotaria socialis]CAF4512106.1 unnamed protein product [Rotaria socialis]